MSAPTEQDHEEGPESDNEAIDLADSLPPLQLTNHIIKISSEDTNGVSPLSLTTNETNTTSCVNNNIDEVLRQLSQDKLSDRVENDEKITTFMSMIDFKQSFDYITSIKTEDSDAGSSYYSNNNDENSNSTHTTSQLLEKITNGRRNSKIPTTAPQKEFQAPDSAADSFVEKNKIKFGHVPSRIDAPRRGSSICNLSKKKSCSIDKLTVPKSSTVESKRKRFSSRNLATASSAPSSSIKESQLNLIRSEDDEEIRDKTKSKFPKSLSSFDSCTLFQETKSMVKSYIKGEGAPLAPNLVKQVSPDATELQYKHVPTQLPDLSAKPSLIVKETAASRKRVEKLQLEIQKQLDLQDATLYMTPLQRKELEVKELRRKLAESLFLIEQQELELDLSRLQSTHEIETFGAEKDEQIVELNNRLLALQVQFETLLQQETLDKAIIQELRDANNDWRLKVDENERKHQANYLLMYEKGRKSANFERQDELEKLALDEPNKVTVEELLAKIEKKELELKKWQTVKLTETYAEGSRVHSDAEATLKFVRDSVFHYLTGAKAAAAQHLRAIIGILQFSTVQMKAIQKSLDERNRKGKI